MKDWPAISNLRFSQLALPYFGWKSPRLSLLDNLVAHTGLEPVISALRGQRVNQLHQCAVKTKVIIGVQRKGWQTTDDP